ncbi:glycoside hydrolase [Nitzschia inconspicua]|uniref:Glycoside hydrolase n=1 Tax=Nitzschia inconspicua TaxID=303405 RepID=A0A9K3PBB9_9STRA|nr:glycoside hydrolase [Nitzschia inconspicua]
MMAQDSMGLIRVLPGKKGACFTMGREENHQKMRTLNPFWYYSWSPTTPPLHGNVSGTIEERTDQQPTSTTIEFLPMFWGYYPKVFHKRIREVLANKPRIILGFNEPDKVAQSNVSVQSALVAWPILEDAIKDAGMSDTILLVSPSCANPLGPWMQTFMDEVNKKQLRVDIIGVHHYGGVNATAFQKRMRTIYESYGGRPLLITELGVADWQATTVQENRFSPDNVLKFMEIILPWMAAQDWIVGYAWFPFDISNPKGTSSALFDRNNHFTPLGKYYGSFLSH